MKKIKIGIIPYGIIVLLLSIVSFIYISDNFLYPDITKSEEFNADLVERPFVYEVGELDLVIDNNDKNNFIVEKNIPSLRRLGVDDSDRYVYSTKMYDRIKSLKIDLNKILTPDYNWKTLYINSLVNIDEYETIDFDGNKTSELNEFIKKNNNMSINILSKEISVDEIVNISSNIILNGNGVKFVNNNQNIFMLDKVSNVVLDGFNFVDNDNVIYVKNSNNIIISNSSFSGNRNYPIIISGGEKINIFNNTFNKNINAVYLMSDVKNSIIQSNIISECTGSANAHAGIVLDASNYIDAEITDNDKPLNKRLKAPHNIIIYGNYIAEGNSSGIYCCGPYQIYVIKNNITSNEKEGICLDWGTIGAYVSENNISYNGFRMHQSDDDLKQDYIFDFGRLDDGSSPAKLPGISLDNAMWNIISNNNINNNAGSGIKTVRSTIENIIIENNIIDNNMGSNKRFHFFGVELGVALDDDELNDLGHKIDLTGDYENIIARNNISGSHYAGVFIAKDCYFNDIIENDILYPKNWSIESLSKQYNVSINNYSNVKPRGLELSDQTYIELPEMVEQ